MTSQQEYVGDCATKYCPALSAGRVGDVALPDVVNEAKRVRRPLDHRGTVRLEVQVVRPVSGLGVGRQHDVRRGRKGICVTDDVRGGCADAAEALAHRDHRRPRHAVHEHLDATHQIQSVVTALHAVRQRQPVEELKRPERRVQPLRHRDRRDHILGDTGTRRRSCALRRFHPQPPFASNGARPRARACPMHPRWSRVTDHHPLGVSHTRPGRVGAPLLVSMQSNSPTNGVRDRSLKARRVEEPRLEEYHPLAGPVASGFRPKQRYYADSRDLARRGNPLLRRTGSWIDCRASSSV